jgi:hypothetical protein
MMFIAQLKTAALITAACVVVAGSGVIVAKEVLTPPAVPVVAQAEPKGLPPTPATNDTATIAWGAVTNELQAGLVPLGGITGWKGFLCPNHPPGTKLQPISSAIAARNRHCVGCVALKPWSPTFIEGEPMRMELHFRNLAKEKRSLYDVRYGNEYWQFTFTSVGGGKVWKTSWPIEDERTMEGIARSTITLGGDEQDAVEMGLERYYLDLVKPSEGQPANRTLPPGKYTVTASYAHPGKYAVHGDPDSCGGHEQGKPCPYWRGTVTTGPVEIEIRQKVGYQVDWTASATAEYEKAVKLLGRNGFAVIRNKAEEKVFMDRLELAGIEASFVIGNRPSEPWANFERGMQVVCWRDLTAADSLRITGVQQTAGGGSGKRDKFRLDLEVKQNNADRNARDWKACCVWIPRVNVLEVPGIGKDGKDEIWTADDKGRDAADGLQACLEVKQTAIKPGDDITLTMSLRNVLPASGTNFIAVWDNKYSNGYRADFYLVVMPDGRSRILRRAVQEAWDKNIPTQIAIYPGKSWSLAGMANDVIVKSLKSFGLDTSQEGVYTVTGYYEANGYQGDRVDRSSAFWGGQIATPPVEVRVGANKSLQGESMRKELTNEEAHQLAVRLANEKFAKKAFIDPMTGNKMPAMSIDLPPGEKTNNRWLFLRSAPAGIFAKVSFDLDGSNPVVEVDYAKE